MWQGGDKKWYFDIARKIIVARNQIFSVLDLESLFYGETDDLD